MQRIARDIYVETVSGGVNFGAIVTPVGVVCVDTPASPAEARKWQLRLAQVTDRPVCYVINLDHHRDRVLGNAGFDVPALAHDATHERIRTLPDLFKAAPPEAEAGAASDADADGARMILPALTFSSRLTLSLGGQEIHLTHRPGPAPGAIWVEVPAQQVIFVGDLLTNNVPPFLNGDLDTWLANLAELGKKRILARVIVPGRGACTDKKGIKPMADFLRLARRRVAALVRARKSRADAAALADVLLPAFHAPLALREQYLRRLRTGLETLYESLLAAS